MEAATVNFREYVKCVFVIVFVATVFSTLLLWMKIETRSTHEDILKLIDILAALNKTYAKI